MSRASYLQNTWKGQQWGSLMQFSNLRAALLVLLLMTSKAAIWYVTEWLLVLNPCTLQMISDHPHSVEQEHTYSCWTWNSLASDLKPHKSTLERESKKKNNPWAWKATSSDLNSHESE
jgi:hypothetical protein